MGKQRSSGRAGPAEGPGQGARGSPPKRGSPRLVLQFEPTDEQQEDGVERVAERSSEWVVSLEASDAPFYRASWLEVLDERWYEENDQPLLFVYDLEADRWVRRFSSSTSSMVSNVELAWPLVPLDRRTKVIADNLRERLASARAAAFRLSPSMRVEASLRPEAAAERAMELRHLVDRCDVVVELRLEADSPAHLRGDSVRMVMSELGLTWGDMGLYHWNNPYRWGERSLFSVSTTSEPGSFFPRATPPPRDVDDLYFAFSVPRSPAPRQVFESMWQAAAYARERLGGAIYNNGNRKPIARPIELREHVDAIAHELEEAGFVPGSSAAMVLFS